MEKGDFLTILGKSSSGKSTLFKILSGEKNYSGNVLVFKKSIKYSIDKGILGLVSLSSDYFSNSSVVDKFISVLKFKGRAEGKIDQLPGRDRAPQALYRPRRADLPLLR